MTRPRTLFQLEAEGRSGPRLPVSMSALPEHWTGLAVGSNPHLHASHQHASFSLFPKKKTVC